MTGVFLGIAGETMGLTLAVVAIVVWGGVSVLRSAVAAPPPKRDRTTRLRKGKGSA